jgi:hypothetical protein
MTFVRSVAILLGYTLLGGGLQVALADCPLDDGLDTVTVSAVRTTEECNAASKERARELASEASREGAHQRAAECYLVAGDPVKADRSYAKALHLSTAQTSEKLTATVGDAKLQARRMREAFRRR